MQRYRKSLLKDKSFIIAAIITTLTILTICAGVMAVRETNQIKNTAIQKLNSELDPEGVTGNKNDSKNVSNADDIKANTEKNAISNSNKAVPKTTDNIANKDNSNKEIATNSNDVAKDNASVVEAPSSAPSNANSGEVSPSSGEDVTALYFDTNQVLAWPVDDFEVILSFSPDSTIYHQTLDMYKTTDYILISSDVDTTIKAPYKAVVKSIDYNEEIGNNITLDLGSGYLLTIGNIKDIKKNVGDIVNPADELGLVATPTKYYSKEGPCIYLKLTKDAVAVDPLDYFNYE